MFAESLLESGTVHHRGRGWTTVFSISIQSLLVAALVALPMFRPDALPLAVKSITSPVAFGRPDVPPDPERGPRPAEPTEAELIAPRQVPTGSIPRDPATTDEVPTSCIPFCGSLPPGDKTGIKGILNMPVSVNPPPVIGQPAERPVVSHIALGTLISRMQPVYPPLAVRTGTEGTVLLRALIDRQGRITQVQVLSGHPLLQQAARTAVEQWRYRPYILNGHPVEVETQITVNFKLAR